MLRLSKGAKTVERDGLLVPYDAPDQNAYTKTEVSAVKSPSRVLSLKEKLGLAVRSV
jgi:hypothetical protein